MLFRSDGHRTAKRLVPAIRGMVEALGVDPDQDLDVVAAQCAALHPAFALEMEALLGITIAPTLLTGTRDGWWPALRIEFFMAATMMLMVLYMSTHHSQSRYTGIYAGALVAVFITLFAPISGMSMNPARSFGSAMPSGVWAGFWIYVTAPPLGMLAAAEVFLWREGKLRVKCCKLHHDNDKRCIFCSANGGFPDLSKEKA